MSILSGLIKERKYKKTADGYILTSQYTDSSTVGFSDGSTAATNLEAIKGITDSLNSDSSNIALSAKAGKELNNNLTSPTIGRFIFDYQNGVAEYNTSEERGADTFHPFKTVGKDTGNISFMFASGYNYSPYVTFPCIGYSKYSVSISNNSTYRKGLYVEGSSDNGASWVTIAAAGGTALNSTGLDISNYNLLRIRVTDGYGGASTGIAGCYGSHRFYN